MTDLVLALDVTDPAAAVAVAEACAPHIDAVKVGYPLVLRSGLSIARELAPLGLPLVADFKVADIPHTNRLIAEATFSAGFHGIICHGFCGEDSVLACVEAARDHGGKCLVVAEMSHPGALAFFSGDVPERISRLAVSLGADGIIAPATRPGRVRVLREIVGSLLVWAPGAGAQGGDPSAVAPLVDGLIVGRQIYQSPDPAAEAARLRTILR
ncbi:MAG: orotidine-5'-phosphate decarboxylase [Methanolinea sp.]|nr:orotidine-5'-phosphate decarboxylase [Methanolinea sp.]